MPAVAFPANLLQRLQSVPLLIWQRLILLLAVFLIVLTLARVTWRVHDMLTWTVPPAPVAAADLAPPRQVNVDELIAAELFGSAVVAEAPSSETEAPDSSAALKLLGVFASDNEKNASAIIGEASGGQSVVFVGEPVPGGYGTLKLVFRDRVVIDRGGRLETLRMEDLTAQLGDLSGGAEGKEAEAGAPRTLDKRKDVQLTQTLNDMRGKLRDNPAALTDVISIEPQYDKASGQLQGYRLGPGKDRKLFGRFGLQRNDLVTAINGVTLDDPTRTLSLLDELNNAKELTLDLQRGGQPVTVQLSLQNP